MRASGDLRRVEETGNRLACCWTESTSAESILPLQLGERARNRAQRAMRGGKGGGVGREGGVAGEQTFQERGRDW